MKIHPSGIPTIIILFIGVGGRDVGMDQVYFNPDGIRHKEEVTFEIKCLTELKDIF